MTSTPRKNRIVFLFDVDNTLLDNDRVAADLKRHLVREVGTDCAGALLGHLRGTARRARLCRLPRRAAALPRRAPARPHLLEVSSFLVDYPFANRLFPSSLDVVEYLSGFGPTVILSDGDVVFQPRKVERSGLFDTVEGRVLIYIHKEQELDDVEQRYPADHYVLVDDKVRILTAIKNVWGERLTTVFPRQGHYARDPHVASYPAPDITIERIGDLLDYDQASLLGAARKREDR